MRFQGGGQNEVVRLPFSPSFVGVRRSSGDSNQRLTGKRVDRLSPPTVLNREQTELMEIQAARVGRWDVGFWILSGRCGERASG